MPELTPFLLRIKSEIKSIKRQLAVRVYLLFCYFHSLKVTKMRQTNSILFGLEILSAFDISRLASLV